jgi:two-component system chemotaxis response regulator CheY
MIVDDELFFRQMLRDILEDDGFTVVAKAVDGVEAVEQYGLHRPDVTVMDIYMPKKSGFDAAREILSLDPKAKIVICSGLGYDEDVQAALKIGVKDVILKPFIKDEVIEIINRIAVQE